MSDSALRVSLRSDKTRRYERRRSGASMLGIHIVPTLFPSNKGDPIQAVMKPFCLVIHCR